MIELIIGREAGTDTPRLAVTQDGKTVFFGKPGSVPKGVSRKHCKVTLNAANCVTIEDITDNNFMYINGRDCKRKENVALTDTIELGPTKYPLDLETILKMLSANQVYSIKHLEEVYNSYREEKFALQKMTGTINALSAIPGVISTLSIILMFIFNEDDGRMLRTALLIVAVLGMVVFAIIRYRFVTVIPKKTNEIEERFRENYVCPNSACNRFLGATPYKELKKIHSCPYCKCKFTE